MRVAKDLRKSVVFFGNQESGPDSDIDCGGTGFLIAYDGGRYLVTAAHVAEALKQGPFVMRVNLKDGSSDLVQGDETVEWHTHNDKTVDCAVTPIGLSADMDQSYLSQAFLEIPARSTDDYFGIGDMTYTVGLFKLLAGKKRNVPIVHSGSIALMPGEERMPVNNWVLGAENKVAYVDGYLIETHSLAGLSGAPVFGRSEVTIGGVPLKDGTKVGIRVPTVDVHLLGLWQGSWDAPPNEIMAMSMQRPTEARVPVGFGIVVPAVRIKEVLDLPELKEQRDKLREQKERSDLDSAPSPDSSLS